MGSLTRFARGLRPEPQLHRGTGWQVLREPISGHSIVDGVPVPVVAVKRNSATGELEVVRGYHPSAGWLGTDAPLDAKRHIVPALSFNPHPRRELTIGGQKFFLSSVPNSVPCLACASLDNGFSFIRSASGGSGSGDGQADVHSFCVPCAEKLARVVVAEA
jgi:hypothetical protein